MQARRVACSHSRYNDNFMYCLGCNYDLSGLGAGPCPECGQAFDPGDDSTFSDVPRRERSARWCEIIIIALAANPLIAYILVHATLVAARVSLGRWPNRWGRDAPLDVQGIAWLITLTTISLFAIPASVLISLHFLYILACGRAWGRIVRALLLASVLWIAAIWMVRWDPAQAWRWFSLSFFD